MIKPIPNSDEFSNLLIDAIDKALSSLGEGPKSAIYIYLEKTLNLQKLEIPARIDEFSNAIEDLFGLGAKFLEISIMKNLHSEVGVAWELKAPNPWVIPDLTFKEYVGFIKKYFEDAREYEEQIHILTDENEALERYK